jgi:hypothetical protein
MKNRKINQRHKNNGLRAKPMNIVAKIIVDAPENTLLEKIQGWCQQILRYPYLTPAERQNVTAILSVKKLHKVDVVIVGMILDKYLALPND